MVRLSLTSAAALLLSSTSPVSVSAFQVPNPTRTTTTTTTTTSLQATQVQTVDISEAAPRDYNGFAEWAYNYGVEQECGFQIAEQYGEWGIVAGEDAQAGSRVLYVPASLRITSSAARTQEFAHLAPSIAEYFDATNSNGQLNLASQFYLFVKVLQEYDQGSESPYFAWLNALPRKFNTALQFNDFEMDCLPPFVKFLANTEKFNYDLFSEVLNSLDFSSISPQTKQNRQITQWAFNVVFTRARAAFDEAEIIPMADMLNHQAFPNVEVQYDNDGNVHLTLLQSVQAGEPLYKMYGTPTNPSKFLATYGFFDTSPPATYCKLMAGKTLTPELVNLGFVYERMVFYVEDGGIASEVWDVMLYTLLGEYDVNAQQQFYNAHMQSDSATKQSMHAQYQYQTATALLQHVDEMLQHLQTCLQKCAQGNANQHEHLPMISQHNEFVQDTFLKVRANVEQVQQSCQ